MGPYRSTRMADRTNRNLGEGPADAGAPFNAPAASGTSSAPSSQWSVALRGLWWRLYDEVERSAGLCRSSRKRDVYEQPYDPPDRVGNARVRRPQGPHAVT